MNTAQQPVAQVGRFDWRARWKTVLLFLAVIGPGIITANADNDAGGITTYSLAGSQFGYSMLWTLIPITIALIVVQEMCARMGAITGKGLSDLIRENFGLRITVFVLIGLLLADLGNTVAEFSGIAASMEIFGISKYFAIPVSGAFVWWLIVRGNYRGVEKYFLGSCFFYVAYLISGWMAHPPWGQVIHETLVPTSFQFKPSYISMLVGVVGTTIAPWMQFYIQSAVVEKRIKPEQYALSRWDVIVGCVVTDVVAFFIIVACGATIYLHHVPVNDARDVAMALQPLAGKWAARLFAFGLFNASLFTASILPLATAYYICEGMGWEAGIGRTFKEAPAFITMYSALIIVGGAIVMIPKAPLLAIMFWSQVVNGVLLAPVLIFMLVLINKKRIMGAFTNSRTYNLLAWLTVAVMIVLTLLLVITQFFPNLLGGG
ncbi:MAG: Nramp family divalent metal transporter [Candidatus Xenobia bacterium]